MVCFSGKASNPAAATQVDSVHRLCVSWDQSVCTRHSGKRAIKSPSENLEQGLQASTGPPPPGPNVWLSLRTRVRRLLMNYFSDVKKRIHRRTWTSLHFRTMWGRVDWMLVFQYSIDFFLICLLKLHTQSVSSVFTAFINHFLDLW